MEPTKKKYYQKSTSCLALAFLLYALSFQGCKKFVEIPPPTTELVTATVFSNNATATSALTNIYTLMFTASEGYNLSNNLGMYSDELTNYCTELTYTQLYTNSLTATGSQINSSYTDWAAYYNYIYDANAVINGLQTNVGCSATVKQQLTGEAYFIRAYWHFYLTNIYGSVPLALTTNYAVTSELPRTPRAQVLQQVISDLHVAQTLLNSNYIDGSDTVVTNQRVRPCKAAATALLARAYLYLGDYTNGNALDYQKADSAATAVITNSNYSLSLLNNVFLQNSSEAIWQIQTPSNQGSDTPEGNSFILLGAPQTSEDINSSTISPQLLNSFEPGDQRKADWIGSIIEGTTTYYFPYKYKQNSNAGKEYEMVLRLGEQYLIRAEARAHEGNLTGAQADLNTIRSRAGLPNTTAASPTALLAAILHERQVELFTEWGARWLDLCRTTTNGTPNAALVMGSPGNVTQFKGGTWNPDNHQLLFPIPHNDLVDDHNLTQNQGY